MTLSGRFNLQGRRREGSPHHQGDLWLDPSQVMVDTHLSEPLVSVTHIKPLIDDSYHSIKLLIDYIGII